MDKNRRITKVHLADKGNVTLHWQEWNETRRGWSADLSLRESEPPLPSLEASLDALAQDVHRYREELCDLAKIKVNGVNWFYGKTDDEGEAAGLKVLITASRAVGHCGPVTANTQRLPVEHSRPDSSAWTVSADTEARLMEVANEAFRYIDGERAQMEVSLSEPDATGDLFSQPEPEGLEPSEEDAEVEDEDADLPDGIPPPV